MTSDREWIERHLGVHPIAKPPPATFAFARTAKTAQSLAKEKLP